MPAHRDRSQFFSATCLLILYDDFTWSCDRSVAKEVAKISGRKLLKNGVAVPLPVSQASHQETYHGFPILNSKE